MIKITTNMTPHYWITTTKNMAPHYWITTTTNMVPITGLPQQQIRNLVQPQDGHPQVRKQ